VRALTERASIYHAKGEFDRAIADYDAAISGNPNLQRRSMAGRGLSAKTISIAPSPITTRHPVQSNDANAFLTGPTLIAAT